MIISDSAGGKCEQKSLGDREGPHTSPGPIVSGASLFSHSLLSIASQLRNNICVCELWTSEFTHWHLVKI